MYLGEGDETSEVLTMFEDEGRPLMAAFTPDGGHVLTVSTQNAILWKLNGERLATLSHGRPIESIDITPTGLVLLGDGLDGTVHLWHPAAQNDLHQRLRSKAQEVTSRSAESAEKRFRLGWDRLIR